MPLTQAPATYETWTGILVPHQVVVRIPLHTWSRDVTHRVHTLRHARRDAAACIDILACFNEGALIEAHLGRYERSESLCHRALLWVSQTARLTDWPSI